MDKLKIKTKKIDERIAENYTKIKIGGMAKIIYGDNVIKCRNKFTRYFMSSVILIIAQQEHTHECSASCIILETPSWNLTARVGTDVSTPSSPDMADLVSKIDIAPDSTTRRLIKEPDYTLYMYEIVFTWNTGTLPDIYEGAPGDGSIDGKVGEFGVYLDLDNDDWATGTINPRRMVGEYRGKYMFTGMDHRLASRIASRDGAFDAFEFYGSIDLLIFKWRFQVAIV